MATKTISVDLEAYRRLVQARKHSRESFSQVIKRAQWEESDYTGEAILAALERLEPVEDAVVHELDKAQKQDKPPRDKWRKTSRATRRS
jgi:predicted CopG family antitoxin